MFKMNETKSMFKFKLDPCFDIRNVNILFCLLTKEYHRNKLQSYNRYIIINNFYNNFYNNFQIPDIILFFIII